MYLSNVSITLPLLDSWTMSIISSIGLNACLFSRRCWANFDFVPISEVSEVFLESDFEGSIGLSCVPHFTVGRRLAGVCQSCRTYFGQSHVSLPDVFQ